MASRMIWTWAKWWKDAAKYNRDGWNHTHRYAEELRRLAAALVKAEDALMAVENSETEVSEDLQLELAMQVADAVDALRAHLDGLGGEASASVSGDTSEGGKDGG